MATRENQTIQAALIVFVIITIALAVSTFVFYRSSEEKARQTAELNEQLTTERKRADDNDFKSQLLTYMIGQGDLTEAEIESMRQNIGEDTELADIETKFQNDMKFFGDQYEGRRSYGELVTYLLSPIADLNVRVTDNFELQNQAVQERDTARAADAQKTQVAIDAQAEAAQDLNARTAQFTADMQKADQEKQALQKQITDVQAEAANIRKLADEQVATVKSDLDRAEKLNEQYRLLLADQNPESFDRADGRIHWVNQRSNMVWLNLGRADGLRRQMTFAVYDADAIGIGKVEPKASIEVTQILEDHLAEARILEDNLRNPILPNDQVFTAAWRPGRRLRFALTGVLDVTGDGKDDSALVRNIITRNNAIVDSYVDDNGNTQGEMSPATRYLVIGLPPGGGDSDESFSSYTNMIGEARKIGVDEISLEKLLSYMGYTGEEKTVPLGRRGGDRFRSRTPPEPGGDGAF